MSALNLVRLFAGNATREANALDIALTDYQRRYGDVRFRVVEVRTSGHGRVQFVVERA